MKGLRHILGILLAVACSIQMAGQTLVNGEAFYIYRNDGDFNGFFYDEVQDMRYSKVGLDSIEYDEFVVQEIVTADSLYRIPLCAIDSIGFVQPAIVINPNLKIMEDAGLNDYISAAYMVTNNSYCVEFNSIPTDKLPKVGDILINTTRWIYDRINGNTQGFVFKVTDVTTEADIYTGADVYKVSGVPVENLGELFIKLVSTEYITADENGQPVRRMAGLDNIVGDAGSASFNLLNLGGTLTREFKQSENSNLAISLNYGIRVGIQATYDITMDHMFVKLGMDEEMSAQVGFSGSISSTWEPDFNILPDWIGAIKFPACLPLFETNALPKAFFRVSGAIGIKSTLPSVNFKGHQLVIISDRTGNWINCRASCDVKSGYGSNDNIFQPGDSQISFDGFVQTGVKFDNTIKTNSWAKRIFQSSIGLETYVGPKLSGNITLSATHLTGGTASYEVLKDASLTFSKCTADAELKASVSFLDKPNQTAKFGEGSFSIGDVTLYAVPELKLFDVQQDEDHSKVSIGIGWERDIVWTMEAGYVIRKFINDLPTTEVERVSKPMFRGYKEWYDSPSLKVGTYQIVPFVTVGGHDIFLEEKAVTVSIFPKLKLSVQKIELPAHNGGKPLVSTISYETDAETVSCSISSGTATIDQQSKTITLTIPENESLYSLNDNLTVCWSMKDGVYSRQTSIPVLQSYDTQFKKIIVSMSVYAKNTQTSTNKVDGKYISDPVHSEQEMKHAFSVEFNNSEASISAINGNITINGNKSGVDEYGGTYSYVLTLSSNIYNGRPVLDNLNYEGTETDHKEYEMFTNKSITDRHLQSRVSFSGSSHNDYDGLMEVFPGRGSSMRFIEHAENCSAFESSYKSTDTIYYYGEKEEIKEVQVKTSEDDWIGPIPYQPGYDSFEVSITIER